MSKQEKTPTMGPKRIVWCVTPAPEGELGWVLRELELPEADVAAATVREWPPELLAIVLDNFEQRVSRRLVERIEDAPQVTA